MEINRDLLLEAGLSNTFDWWQTALLWSAAITAGLTLITAGVGCFAFYARYKVQNDLPLRAEAARGNLRQSLSLEPPSAWPDWYMVEQGWRHEKDLGELKVFTLSAEPLEGGANTTGIIFKNGSQTVAWAEAIALGDHYVWPYAEDSYELEDGDNTVPIQQAISGTGIANIIRQSPTHFIDVIGVGLESSDGGDPDDEYRELSDNRGMQLAFAARSVIEEPSDSRRVGYRSLGLGRAMNKVARGSQLERQQRSALLVVVARMSHDEIRLPLTDTLSAIVMDVDINTLSLADYEYSCAAEERLSGVWVDDPNAQEWEVPKISVAEALARRPCQHS